MPTPLKAELGEDGEPRKWNWDPKQNKAMPCVDPNMSIQTTAQRLGWFPSTSSAKQKGAMAQEGTRPTFCEPSLLENTRNHTWLLIG